MPLHYMPDSPGAYVAVTTSHATLIRTAKQNSLTIAVSGTGHWIHNTTPCTGIYIYIYINTTYTFRRRFNEKPSIIPGSLGHALVCI